jgi:hypothetical protein
MHPILKYEITSAYANSRCDGMPMQEPRDEGKKNNDIADDEPSVLPNNLSQHHQTHSSFGLTIPKKNDIDPLPFRHMPLNSFPPKHHHGKPFNSLRADTPKKPNPHL